MMATRKLFKGLVALLFVVTSAARAADVDFAKAVAEAQKQEDLGAVNRLCNEWIEAKPQDERPRLILGRIYLKLDKVDLAVEQFELAAEANPLSAEPRCLIGDVFRKAGQREAAEKEYGQALHIDPKCLAAILGKARIKLEQGDAEAAFAEARQAQQHAPDDPSVAAFLGETLLALGSAEDALTEARRGIEQAPTNAAPWYCCALALESLGRAEEAGEAWQRFVELEPDGQRATRVRNGWVVLGVDQLFPSLTASAESAAVSPDGRYVAFVVRPRGIFRASLLDQGAPTLITPCPEGWGQRSIRWSPDGSELLYYEASTGANRVRRVAAAPDQEPMAVDVPGVKSLAHPAWSPSGGEIHVSSAFTGYVIDASTGETRTYTITDEAGKRLYRSAANYMPNGRQLVGALTIPRQNSFLHLASIDAGKALAKLFDYEGMRPGAVAVSSDGTTVAVTAYPSDTSVTRSRYIALVSVLLPYADVRLGAYHDPYATPGWHPEGRKLVARLGGAGHSQLSVVRLGGLDCRPVGVAIARKDDGALSATVTNRTENAQSVSLRWEAFDSESLRLGAAVESEAPVEFQSGERVEWAIELSAEQKKSAVTVKVTVLNQDGVGAVKLVDWAGTAPR